MAGIDVAEQQGRMPASDVDVFQHRLEAGYQRWLTVADLQCVAADWYATGQEFCRQRIHIDEILQILPTWNPRGLMCRNAADDQLNNFRQFVRHYLTRGYEDALK